MTTANTINRPFAPNAERLAQLVEYYNTHGKLPTNKVTCTVSGYAATMFGDNLKDRVEKFGGIENLLTKFIWNGELRKMKAQGIVPTDLPPRTRTGVTRNKNLTPLQIEEQIRQLEAMKSAMTKTEVKADAPAPADAENNDKALVLADKDIDTNDIEQEIKGKSSSKNKGKK